MPKRSNTFQRLVALLERALNTDGVSVRESVLMKDLRTGEYREVDIVIEGTVGTHKATIGIEVIDHSRPASTPWVESMCQKHADLPIDKTVLVSRSGFYAPAAEKARLLKMDTVSFDKAGKVDWIAKLDQLHEVTLEHFLMPILKEATLVIADMGSVNKLTAGDISSVQLFNRDGVSLGSIESIVQNLMTKPEFLSHVKSNAFRDSASMLDVEYPFFPGTTALSHNGKHVGVSGVKFRAVCEVKVERVTPISGRYRGVTAKYVPIKSFGGTGELLLFEEDGKGEIRVAFKKGQKRIRITDT